MSEFEKIYAQYKSLKISISKESYEKIKMEFIYHSNRLEGSNLTLIQTIDVIHRHKAIGEVSVEDMMMAIDHYRAINEALSFGANKYPLTEKILLSLHETLLKNTFQIDPSYKSWIDSGQKLGQYKIKENRILTTINGKEEYFVTPPPIKCKEMVKEAIELYTKSKDPFLLKLSKLIQNIYNAHPFFDGNKRMTRLVIANQLIANDYPLLIPHKIQNEYNEALIKGYIENSNIFVLNVLERSFNQQISEEIEKYNQARKPNKGFGLIL